MGEFENPRLICGTNTVIEINTNPFSIGRGLSCNYVIIRKTVSRVHCVLEKDNHTWVLKDTSSNGTYVNGTLVKQDKSPPLKSGDIIRVEPEGESFIFQTEADNPTDDISDEQLCIIADSVLNEVEEALQQDVPENQDTSERLPEDNTNVNMNTLTDMVPTVSSTTLPDHLGMAKAHESHLSKKQKTDVGTSIAAITTSTSLVDLAPSGSSTSSNITVIESPKVPGPSSITDKESQKVTPPSGTVVKPVQAQPPQAAASDQQDQYEVMENELQCSICSELFVKAITLNCSHTFCKYCIDLWKKNKSDCPICRTKITGMTSTLVLDNVIEKMVESSTDEVKERRKQLLEERKKQEVPKPPPPQVETTTRGRGRGRGRRGRSGRNNQPQASPPTPVIEVSSESNSDSYSDLSETDSDDTSEWRDEYENDDWYDEGIPGTFYGGYGHCFSCGRRGHWANGCPYR